MDTKKAVVYVNQFFGQIGGEEAADYEPELREGAVGPALAYQSCLGEQIEVTHTLICGDNFISSNPEKALDKIVSLLSLVYMDVFFAGPAFLAGRYGMACGNVCKKVQEAFRIPVFTSMNEENPGVEVFRREMFIFQGGSSSKSMRRDVKKMCGYALRYIKGEKLSCAAEEGYFGRGIRKQVFTDTLASDRAVDMLLRALKSEQVETEVPMPVVEKPAPAPALKELSRARIAIVTTGGLVPADNPDHIQSSSATVWGKYEVTGKEKLDAGDYICIHGGFDAQEANKDPNVIVPLDVMREMEESGVIGSLYPYFYATTGTGTSQAAAERMGKEIAEDLIEEDVDGVLFVST